MIWLLILLLFFFVGVVWLCYFMLMVFALLVRGLVTLVIWSVEFLVWACHQ